MILDYAKTEIAHKASETKPMLRLVVAASAKREQAVICEEVLAR
jgi:hypothetical protein